MKPSAAQLALRDPALMSVLGVGIGKDGGDFGAEADPVASFDPQTPGEFGANSNGDYGPDYNADLVTVGQGYTTQIVKPIQQSSFSAVVALAAAQPVTTMGEDPIIKLARKF